MCYFKKAFHFTDRQGNRLRTFCSALTFGLIRRPAVPAMPAVPACAAAVEPAQADGYPAPRVLHGILVLG